MCLKVLPVLKAHPGRAQAPPEGMLEIVHAHLGKTGSFLALIQALFIIRETGLPR
jgi:hypothetical protein